MESLLTNVDTIINIPAGRGPDFRVRGTYSYYHYCCDGFDDRGWGCGYRTLQTLCSWVYNQGHSTTRDGKLSLPPTIREIQEALVTMQDKPDSFLQSKQWIGSFEVFLCLDYFYDVSCKIVHLKSGEELQSKVELLKEHFQNFGSPIMMGGDSDAASKGILGITMGTPNTTPHLLVLDPHYVGSTIDPSVLVKDGWISWRAIDTFMENSFYNICLPQLKAKS